MWFIQCIECSKCFAVIEWYYLLVTRYLCYKKIFIVLSTNNGTMLATSHGQKKRTRCKLCFVFPLFHWKRIFCWRIDFPNVLENFLTQTEEVLLKKKRIYVCNRYYQMESLALENYSLREHFLEAWDGKRVKYILCVSNLLIW